jgi:hypothetical protein
MLCALLYIQYMCLLIPIYKSACVGGVSQKCYVTEKSLPTHLQSLGKQLRPQASP